MEPVAVLPVVTMALFALLFGLWLLQRRPSARRRQQSRANDWIGTGITGSPADSSSDTGPGVAADGGQFGGGGASAGWSDGGDSGDGGGGGGGGGD